MLFGKLLSVICACMLAIEAASAIWVMEPYDSPGITQLNYFNWVEQVLNDEDHIWVTVFYDRHCSASQEYAEDFLRMAEDADFHDRGVKFGAVNVRA